MLDTLKEIKDSKAALIAAIIFATIGVAKFGIEKISEIPQK